MSRRATGALAALALTIGWAGCGGDDQQAEEAQKHVRTAYAELQSRFEARDAQGVCARISAAAKQQVGTLGHAQPTTCVRDIRQLFKWMKKDDAASAEARPRLVSVAVDDDGATATARLGANATGRIPFVDEDGKWKLDNFFGITAPPSADMQ